MSCPFGHGADPGRFRRASRHGRARQRRQADRGGQTWDSIVTWHETGTGTAGGLDGSYEVWVDLPTLRNRFGYGLGPTTGGSGWDGSQAWTIDSGLEVRIETSSGATAQAIQDAYRRGYGFFFPARFPATREEAGTRRADGQNYDAGRASQLIIGPVKIDAPVTEIATGISGADNDARTAGNIGGDLLKRFTVTLDYGHQTLWLQPNRLAGQREVFDRSGLWIGRAGDGGIEIVDIATESAAASIGLNAGDEIIAVNGQPAKTLALYTLRERFKGAVGT